MGEHRGVVEIFPGSSLHRLKDIGGPLGLLPSGLCIWIHGGVRGALDFSRWWPDDLPDVRSIVDVVPVGETQALFLLACDSGPSRSHTCVERWLREGDRYKRTARSDPLQVEDRLERPRLEVVGEIVVHFVSDANQATPLKAYRLEPDTLRLVHTEHIPCESSAGLLVNVGAGWLCPKEWMLIRPATREKIPVQESGAGLTAGALWKTKNVRFVVFDFDGIGKHLKHRATDGAQTLDESRHPGEGHYFVGDDCWGRWYRIGNGRDFLAAIWLRQLADRTGVIVYGHPHCIFCPDADGSRIHVFDNKRESHAVCYIPGLARREVAAASRAHSAVLENVGSEDRPLAEIVLRCFILEDAVCIVHRSLGARRLWEASRATAPPFCVTEIPSGDSAL